jgi:hypothetical protein
MPLSTAMIQAEQEMLTARTRATLDAEALAAFDKRLATVPFCRDSGIAQGRGRGQ